MPITKIISEDEFIIPVKGGVKKIISSQREEFYSIAELEDEKIALGLAKANNDQRDAEIGTLIAQALP